MTREEIQKEVLDIVHNEKTLPENVTAETPLAEAGIDSLDALNILFALEERFSISIPDDDARKIKTMSDMVDTIERLLRAA